MICKTYHSDDLEYMLITSAFDFPENIAYNDNIKWLQVIHSTDNPKTVYYKSPSGRPKSRKVYRYVCFRLTNTPSDDIINNFMTQKNYIDYITHGSGSSTWYFEIPENVSLDSIGL